MTQMAVADVEAESTLPESQQPPTDQS